MDDQPWLEFYELLLLAQSVSWRILQILLSLRGHHCRLTILGVMVMEIIGVHYKVYVNVAGFVHDKGTFSIVAVIGNMKFATNVLKGKNSVEPNVTVVLDMGLHLGG